MITIISFLIALLFAELFIDEFNNLTNKSLSFFSLLNPFVIIATCFIVFLTGIFSGFYPALILSSIKIQAIMKNSIKVGHRNLLSQILIGVQFLLAALLLSGTLIMSKQLSFMKNIELGYKGDQIISFGIDTKSLEKFKNELANNPNILDVQGLSHSIGRGRINSSFKYQGSDDQNANFFGIESNFLNMMEIPLVSGRNFDVKRASDNSNSILVNEAFVEKFMADKNPLEEKISVESFKLHDARIIGVVQDFYYSATGSMVEPTVLISNSALNKREVIVKLSSANLHSAISDIEAKWYELFPNILFEFKFLDQQMQSLYANEQRWNDIINYSSFIAILISALGLLGMAAISLINKSKEIGIRKILGANFKNILSILFKQFGTAILVSFFIAFPLSYYFSQRWLENYSNRIQPGLEEFLLTAVLICSVAFFTILYFAFKGTKINPVDALRSE